MQILSIANIFKKIDSFDYCIDLSSYLLDLIELVKQQKIDVSLVLGIWEHFMRKYAEVIWREVGCDFSYLLLRKSDLNRLNVLSSWLGEAAKIQLRLPGIIMAEFLAEELGRPFEEVYAELGV